MQPRAFESLVRRYLNGDYDVREEDLAAARCSARPQAGYSTVCPYDEAARTLADRINMAVARSETLRRHAWCYAPKYSVLHGAMDRDDKQLEHVLPGNSRHSAYQAHLQRFR